MTKPHSAILYSDEELLTELRHGNVVAFNELYSKYWRQTYRIAYSKVASREAAEEIVEDFFIKLWQKRDGLVIRNFFAYLYTSVKNRCLNYIEEKTIENKHWEYYKQFLPESDNSTDDTVQFNSLVDAIHAGIQQMPEKSKTVFEMHKMEGKSVKEIAALLNLSEKTIEYHLTNSMKKLRVYLKEFTL